MNRHLLRSVITAASLAGAFWFAGAESSRAQNLTLLVNPSTGATSITNQSFTSSAALQGYVIRSIAGSLAPDPTNTEGVGWDSLTDAGLTGWEEVAPTANALSELNLSSTALLAAGGSLDLGKAFSPGSTRDLTWGYSVAGVVTQPATIGYLDRAQLQVIRLLGDASVVEGFAGVMFNPLNSPISLTGYVIRSAGGSLNPAGFNGFAGHNVPGWESVTPSANALSELNLEGSATIAAGKQQMLGALFTNGAAQDLTFQYHELSAGVTSGTVLYKSVLAGDANEDGVIDIFDVNVVSDNWSQSGPAGDVNFDGVVDIFDVNVISDHWGNALAGEGSVTPVPEPGALGLIVAGLATIAGGGVRRGRRTFEREEACVA